MDDIKGRAKGGKAKNALMTAEERKMQAMKMVKAKREKATLPKATHYGVLKIGEVELPCFVLDDGRRVISGRGLTNAIGMRGRGQGASRVSAHRLIKDYKNNELSVSIDSPIKFVGKSPKGIDAPSDGYEATILQDVCEALLTARDKGLANTEQEKRYVAQADILIRGFARVGIVALIDEATGYEKDRARDSLAKILEAFVAKELQPYIKTFDSEYYEYMFKLRGLKYPPENEDNKPQYRPQYFGKLTNDIVYKRLAPGVLEALKDEAKKAEKKGKLFQHLTAGYGRQELLKHLGGLVWLMKDSDNWDEFIMRLDKVAPRYNSTMELDLDDLN